MSYRPPRYLRFVCLLFFLSTAVFAQLTITTGDHTRPPGRAEIALEATGGSGTYSWSLVTCAVPGLTLRTDVPSWFPPGVTAGLIGVATTAGSHSCTVRVTDGVGNTATKTFYVKIHPYEFTNAGELPEGSEGVFYDQRVTAAGGSLPLTFTLESGTPPFPPGLSFDGTGRIWGTPTTAGVYDFNAGVSDGSFNRVRTSRITVSKLRINTATQLPNGVQGSPYSQSISVSGGTPPYTFSASGLPSGLSMSSGGVLSGTPDQAWHWSIPVTVTDSTGATARKTFALGAVGVPLTLPTMHREVSLDDLPLGEHYWYNIAVAGGTPPYTFAITSGTLPPGIALS